MSAFSLTIDILRHGETPLIGRFCGSTDAELTREGHAQMAKQVQGHTWDAVVTSPLKRCHDFACSMLPPLSTDARLQEMNFGRWEGLSSEEIWAVEPDLLEAFWQDPDQAPPPEGEAWADFLARVSAGFMDMVRSNAGSNLLLITHAGVMRALLVNGIGLSLASAWKISLPPAAMLRLTVTLGENDKLHAQLLGLRGVS